MVKSLLRKCSAPQTIRVDKSETTSAGFTSQDKKILEKKSMQKKIAQAVAAFGLTALPELIGPVPIIAAGAALAAIKAHSER